MAESAAEQKIKIKEFWAKHKKDEAKLEKDMTKAGDHEDVIWIAKCKLYDKAMDEAPPLTVLV